MMVAAVILQSLTFKQNWRWSYWFCLWAFPMTGKTGSTPTIEWKRFVERLLRCILSLKTQHTSQSFTENSCLVMMQSTARPCDR